MDPTSRSLLVRACENQTGAWEKLVQIYEPMIKRWLLRYDVREQDAVDLTQEVLTILIRKIGKFSHKGNPGSFRSWLRTITVNRARQFWRQGKCRPSAPGGSEFLTMMDQLEDPDSDLSTQWNEEHDGHVLEKLFAVVEREFEEKTLRAFQRLTFDRAKPQEVAAELNMSLAAIYGAKSRVLQKLRQLGEGLLD